MDRKKIAYQIILLLVGTVILACAYNFFISSNHLLSGGVIGVSMILNQLFGFNTGTLNFLFNIPILLLGYWKLGRKFIVYSLISVTTLSVTMSILPVTQVVDDLLLASIFGGVIAGLGLGLIFKSTGSSGGFDIIALVILQKRDFPLGIVTLFLNAIVIFTAGFLFDWEIALYTLISMYATSKLIDIIHTKDIKLTLTIITEKGDELEEVLLKQFKRGITIMHGEGAFTNKEKQILYMVVTRYELDDIRDVVREVDSQSFVNITPTLEVIGSFKKI